MRHIDRNHMSANHNFLLDLLWNKCVNQHVVYSFMFHASYSFLPNWYKNQYHENLISLTVLHFPICHSYISTFHVYSLGDPLRVGSSCFAQSFLHLHEEIEALFIDSMFSIHGYASIFHEDRRRSLPYGFSPYRMPPSTRVRDRLHKFRLTLSRRSA